MNIYEKASRLWASKGAIVTSVSLGFASMAWGVADIHQTDRGAYPLGKPEVSARWENTSGGLELVLSGTTHVNPLVTCDDDAKLTRYWDLGGTMIVAEAKRVKGWPAGMGFPVNLAKEGDRGEVRFPEDDVPENALDYVTIVTAPTGSCQPDGWWGSREQARIRIPPRPAVTADG